MYRRTSLPDPEFTPRSTCSWTTIGTWLGSVGGASAGAGAAAAGAGAAGAGAAAATAATVGATGATLGQIAAGVLTTASTVGSIYAASQAGKGLGKIPQAPATPTVDTAKQQFQTADRIKQRRGMFANLFGGALAGSAPQTAAKQLLGK